MSNTNVMQTAGKRIDVRLSEVKDNLENATHQATKGFGRARSRLASQFEKSAHARPFTTVGVLVGAGVVLGAAMHSALRPAPTTAQLLIRTLRRGALSTGDALLSGYRIARRAVR